MSDTTRHLFQLGVHANNQDFTSIPGALVDIRPVEDIVPRPTHEEIERPYQTFSGEKIPSLRGRKAVEVPDASFELEGLSGGGAVNTVAASGLASALSAILEAATGQVENGTGEQTDGADAGTGTNLIASAATSFADGAGVMVQGTNSLRPIAREVVSTSGVNITLDRALTDLTGAADTPNEGVDIVAARTFVFDNDNHDRPHLFFRSQMENDKRDFLGSMPSNVNLLMPPDGTLKLALSGVRCTDYNDPGGANVAYTPPTTGLPIVGTEILMWIDGALYQAYDLNLDFGLVVVPRMSHGGPNGHFGFVWRTSQPILTGKLRRGTLTLPVEVTEAQANTFRGASENDAPTFDIGVQAGSEAGGALYVRMPAARLMLDEEEDEGLRVYSFTAKANESGNHANVPGGCRIHLF